MLSGPLSAPSGAEGGAKDPQAGAAQESPLRRRGGPSLAEIHPSPGRRHPGSPATSFNHHLHQRRELPTERQTTGRTDREGGGGRSLSRGSVSDRCKGVHFIPLLTRMVANLKTRPEGRRSYPPRTAKETTLKKLSLQETRGSGAPRRQSCRSLLVLFCFSRRLDLCHGPVPPAVRFRWHPVPAARATPLCCRRDTDLQARVSLQ